MKLIQIFASIQPLTCNKYLEKKNHEPFNLEKKGAMNKLPYKSLRNNEKNRQ